MMNKTKNLQNTTTRTTIQAGKNSKKQFDFTEGMKL